MDDKGSIILYTTPDGASKIEVTLQDETVWLTIDQMAELFQRNKSTISRHIKHILESGELMEEAVVAKNATTATDGKNYQVAYYNLDMIISVGYRVNSYRGVQFRQWATMVLKEYIRKGFVLNDELLKNAGKGNYFDELLARIRDIGTNGVSAIRHPLFCIRNGENHSFWCKFFNLRDGRMKNNSYLCSRFMPRRLQNK